MEIGITDYIDVVDNLVNERDISDTEIGIAIFILVESNEISENIKSKLYKLIDINKLNEGVFSNKNCVLALPLWVKIM